ncbi:MAG TPA: redoxin domain-containing protein [Candidatus Polarisedimenticolia bacterium]|nr:redoxin domain-containing protein [Candidatus Polarisedimenticolia bacterium]
MQRLRVLILLAAAWLLGAAEGQPPPGRVPPGERMAPLKLMALKPGATALAPLDLAASIGRRPVVICYFLLGEALGEEALLHVQELAETELKGKADVYGAMKLGQRITIGQVAERLSLLGITLPVIVEEDLVLGGALGLTMAPAITLIDGSGTLRIADAKSLRQTVAPGLTMADAIRAAAKRGAVPTVARLPRYFPANELIGEQFPDFILKRFKSTERIKLSEVVARAKADGKITAVFFWHPDCKHCKKAMPGIVTGFHSYRKWLEIVSVSDLKNANEVVNAEDTIRAHKIPFPVLEDEGRRITDLYKVVSTPTMIFVRPDGVIDSVYTSGEANYVPIFSSRIQSILKAGRKYEGKAAGRSGS